MAQEHLMEVRHLSKTFGAGNTAVKALNDVSFTLDKGVFAAVTGESGSGKTTLLNVVGSLLHPDAGEVLVDGQDITQGSDDDLSVYRRRRIGFIFQNYNLIPVLTVEENIVLPLNLDSTEPDYEYLGELLRMTGLESKRRNFPHELSGGQQQRAAFVRALIHRPEIILADEPTGNLDTKNSREIISILKESVKKYNQGLLLITHDLTIAAQADVVFQMNDGVLTRLENGVSIP
ncbi:MAG: ABC transporter ATP-binding protein [Oscillospiraceae bacterium]|nr:ABC transporter ATP-binding protein [Oscillospiraceae bacterium]